MTKYQKKGVNYRYSQYKHIDESTHTHEHSDVSTRPSIYMSDQPQSLNESLNRECMPENICMPCERAHNINAHNSHTKAHDTLCANNIDDNDIHMITEEYVDLSQTESFLLSETAVTLYQNEVICNSSQMSTENDALSAISLCNSAKNNDAENIRLSRTGISIYSNEKATRKVLYRTDTCVHSYTLDGFETMFVRPQNVQHTEKDNGIFETVNEHTNKITTLPQDNNAYKLKEDKIHSDEPTTSDMRSDHTYAQECIVYTKSYRHELTQTSQQTRKYIKRNYKHASSQTHNDTQKRTSSKKKSALKVPKIYITSHRYAQERK